MAEHAHNPSTLEAELGGLGAPVTQGYVETLF